MISVSLVNLARRIHAFRLWPFFFQKLALVDCPHTATRYEAQLSSVEIGRAELHCDDEPSSRLGNAHLNIESLKSDRANSRTPIQQHVQLLAFRTEEKRRLKKLPKIVHAVIACCQQNDSKTRFEAGNGDHGHLVGIPAIRIYKALIVNFERSYTKGLIEIVEDLPDREGQSMQPEWCVID